MSKSPAPVQFAAPVLTPSCATLIDAWRYARPEKNFVGVRVDGVNLRPAGVSPNATAISSSGVVAGSHTNSRLPFAFLKPISVTFDASPKQVASTASRVKSPVHDRTDATGAYVVVPAGSIDTSPLYPCCLAITLASYKLMTMR